MVFEIQAHGASSRLALRSLRAARPSVLVVPHAESVFPLAEALDLAGDTPVVVEASAVEPRAFAQALAPFLPRVSLRSFDERILAEARRLHPNLETTLLFDQPLRLATAAGRLGHDTRRAADASQISVVTFVFFLGVLAVISVIDALFRVFRDRVHSTRRTNRLMRADGLCRPRRRRRRGPRARARRPA